MLEEVVSEFNVTWSSQHNIRMEIIKWETHSRPGFGADAQAVINQQISNDFDIFLGIMWGRFGTPTNRAESGTEEEFYLAYNRVKSSPGSVQIMFYFKDAGLHPSKINTEQLSKVQNFKKKISTEYGALTHSFESTEEFATKVRIHLSKSVQDVLNGSPPLRTEVKSVLQTKIVGEPLANLAAVRDDEEADEGVIELTERATESMESLKIIIEEMTDAQKKLNDSIVKRTAQMNELQTYGSPPDNNAIKRISNDTAQDIEDYVEKISSHIPNFKKHILLAMDNFGKAAIISSADFKQNGDVFIEVLRNIRNMREAFEGSASKQTDFKEAVVHLPRMTTKFNRARRRLVAVLEDLLALNKSAVNQTEDVEQLLERIIQSKIESPSVSTGS